MIYTIYRCHYHRLLIALDRTLFVYIQIGSDSRDRGTDRWDSFPISLIIDKTIERERDIYCDMNILWIWVSILCVSFWTGFAPFLRSGTNMYAIVSTDKLKCKVIAYQTANILRVNVYIILKYPRIVVVVQSWQQSYHHLLIWLTNYDDFSVIFTHKFITSKYVQSLECDYDGPSRK